MNAVGTVAQGNSGTPASSAPPASTAAAPASPAQATSGTANPAAASRGPSPAVRALLAAYGGDTLSDPSLLPRLPRITVPTLAIWGKDDPIVSVDVGRQIANAIPTATFLGVPDAGHVPFREQPTLVFDQIRRFDHESAGQPAQ